MRGITAGKLSPGYGFRLVTRRFLSLASLYYSQLNMTSDSVAEFDRNGHKIELEKVANLRNVKSHMKHRVIMIFGVALGNLNFSFIPHNSKIKTSVSFFKSYALFIGKVVFPKMDHRLMTPPKRTSGIGFMVL